MSQTIYLITQEGNYRHSIFGAFTDVTVAMENAIHLADTDVDRHHSYAVLPIEIDVLLERDRIGYAVEQGFVAEYRKSPK